MTSPRNQADDREERWGEVLVACLEAIDSGQSLDCHALTAEHPEFAGELAAFLAEQDRIEQLAAPLRAVAQEGAAQAESDVVEDTCVMAPAGAPDPAARSFGDYEILERIAQGGMGVVYKARQISLNRLVALKMIRSRDLGMEQEQRFRHEAEIVAGLDHPHIVPIYEVGEEAGRHFYSMRLMEGGSLSDWLRKRFTAENAETAEEKLREKKKPLPATSLPSSSAHSALSAVSLFIRVARAVHHAHQHGIIHRDLKPANILLDRDGSPHVSDFGLARRVACDSELTQSGALVGTPSYMAPEQVGGKRGAVTTVTDVYGLGAVLYFLLTGQPPFRGETTLETLRQVQEKAPARPREINPRVDRDLQTICLKCLAKEPPRRYPSAEAVADELERWLAGEPIEARPIGTMARLWRWCRRNPAVAGLSTSLAVVLLVAVGALLFSWVRVRQSLKEEAEQRRQADAARREAEANFLTACRTVDQMLTRVAARDLAHTPQMTSVQRKLLGDALAFWQGMLAQRGNDPAVRRQAGRAYQLMGQINQKLGRLDDARANYDQAITLLQQLADDYPDVSGYRRELAAGHHNRSLVLQVAGRLREAEQAQRQALAILEKLVTGERTDQTARYELANAQQNWGILLEQTGRASQAEKAYREALRLRQQLADDGLDDRRNRHERAATLHDLATLLADMNRPQEAEPLLRQALAVQQGLVAQYGSVPDHRVALAKSHASLGRLLKKARPQEAEAAYRKAVELQKKLATDFPEVPAYRQDLANSYNSLGLFLRESLRYTDAGAAHREALALQQGLAAAWPDVPGYQSDLGATLNNLGLLDFDSGNLAEARRLFERAIHHQRLALDKNPRNPTYRQFLRKHYWILGETLLELKDHGAAAVVAASLAKALPDDGQAAHDAAGCLARCVPLAEQDARLTAARRKELGQAYGQRAVETLRQAVQQGFRNGALLAKDPSFAPLRQRKDFQEVLSGLKQREKR